MTVESCRQDSRIDRMQLEGLYAQHTLEHRPLFCIDAQTVPVLCEVVLISKRAIPQNWYIATVMSHLCIYFSMIFFELGYPLLTSRWCMCVLAGTEASRAATKAEEAFNLALDYFRSADDVYHQVSVSNRSASSVDRFDCSLALLD